MQNFVIKIGESSFLISATLFTIANSFGLHSPVFFKNPINIFHISILNTVCLKNIRLGQKRLCMFAVTQPSLLKSANPKLFFAGIFKKL